MSYRLVQACMDMRGEPLSSTEWRVFLVLCRYAGEDSTCFPTRQTIADAGRLNVRSVIDALHTLKEKGWIDWTQPAGKKRTFSIFTSKMMAYLTPVQESTREGCGKVHPGGAERCTGGVQESAPEYVIEEVKEEVKEETPLPPPPPAAKREAQTHRFSLAEIPDASKEKTRTQAFKPPELGVELTESAFRDWMTVRKAKHSPLTETAWKHFKAQVLRSELSIQQAVELCATKGWISINAEWQAVKDYQAEFDSRSSNDRKVDFVIKALGLTDNRKETEK